MSTKEVEETLANEVELLRAMVEFVRNYPNENFTGSGKFIQESWAKFLTQRSETNMDVAGAGKKAAKGIKKDMKAERRQLKVYITASECKPRYSEEWQEFFECEKRILDHLLGMLKKP